MKIIYYRFRITRKISPKRYYFVQVRPKGTDLNKIQDIILR